MFDSSILQELKAAIRVIYRGIFLLLPIVLLQLAELFILPLDTFTFRVWEAALSIPYRYPGPYYPNVYIQKEREYGDQYRQGGIHSEVSKPVEWYTDSYGWRNRPEVEQKKKYDVVIVGDSNIVGSFLDQKNTLSEVLMERSGKAVYSYSFGSDHFSLLLSDRRVLDKNPELLVMESKAGNWFTNSDYLYNFTEMPDGSLGVRNRSAELREIYRPGRNYLFESLRSRFDKHAMLYWLQATLATDFNKSPSHEVQTYIGMPSFSASDGKEALRPNNWVFANSILKPLPGASEIAFKMQAVNKNAYWKTDLFKADNVDGKIILRFEAKGFLLPSRHRVWVHEDGEYRSIGEFVANSSWQYFEIPIPTKMGSELQIQIDSPIKGQWLSIRDFRIVGGKFPPVQMGAPKEVLATEWSVSGEECADRTAFCRRWVSSDHQSFMQIPLLPQSATSGTVIRFEARSDKPATAFTPVYYFQGEEYHVVANYAYGKEWRKYELFIRPKHGISDIKLQLNYPVEADWMEVRNFQVAPVNGIWNPKLEHSDTSLLQSDLKQGDGMRAVIVSPPFQSGDGESDGFDDRNVISQQSNPFPRPPHLTPLGQPFGRLLSAYESQFYLYHAAKTAQRQAKLLGMDFILFIMPDTFLPRLIPAVKQLRSEGVKVLTYEGGPDWSFGVDLSWYWQQTDSHWSEAAVRLTADEILRMWTSQKVENRPFSGELREAYSLGFPDKKLSEGN